MKTKNYGEDLDLSQLGTALAEDTRRFLISLAPETRQLFERRLGFGMAHCTLEALAREQRRTRERMRQIQALHFKHLQQSCRMTPATLRNRLRVFRGIVDFVTCSWQYGGLTYTDDRL